MPTAARRHPERGPFRLARVAALGGGSLLLATLAHVVAGGRLPSAGVLAVTGLLLGLVALTLTVRRCRFGVLLVALTAQQVLLHLLFDAASGVAPGCSPLTMSSGHAAHAVLGHCGMPAAMSSTLPAWTMWGAHLVATLLTAALLARGETWLWRAADRVVAAAGAAPGPHPRPGPTTLPVLSPRSAAGRQVVRPEAPRAPPHLLSLR